MNFLLIFYRFYNIFLNSRQGQVRAPGHADQVGIAGLRVASRDLRHRHGPQPLPGPRDGPRGAQSEHREAQGQDGPDQGWVMDGNSPVAISFAHFQRTRPGIRLCCRPGVEAGVEEEAAKGSARLAHQHIGIVPHSQTFQSPTSSSSATRPIQSRPAASSAHAMDGPSTAVPAPSSTERELESPDDFTDSMAGEQSPTGGGTSSKSPSSQPSGGDEPAAEDWLMLRNVVIVFLLLLALFFLVVLCYKRHLCCFTKQTSSSGSSANGGAQQRNGKPVIRVQNGKEYREPGK
jgi:hypothetical protein